MENVFLASRFNEFESLRKEIVKYFKNSKGINIVNLDSTGVDIRTPTIKSIDTVSSCNFLLLLVGDTYGEIPDNFDESITHLEFLTADRLDKPWLAFYIGKHNNLSNDSFSINGEHPKLVELKKSAFSDINKSVTCAFDIRTSNLASKVCGKIEAFFDQYEKFISDPNREFDFGVRKVPIEKYYLKRKEIADITKALIEDKSRQFGIVGMGGVGKSVIASDIAHSEEIRQHFENVYFVRIDKAPDKLEKIITLLHYLPINRGRDFENLSFKEGFDKLKTFFKNRKILLILDNVWDPSIISQLDFLNNESKILITTRKDSVLTNSIPFKIDCLEEDEAIQLFRKINLAEVDEDVLSKIIQKSGKLPLAITIIASKLKNKPSEFYDAFVTGYKVSNVNYTLDTDKEQHNNLFNVIDFTFNDFEQKIKDGFLFLSLFPEGRLIRFETLNTVLKENWIPLISELSDYHLINQIKDIKGNTVYVLHDLIREFIVEKAHDQIVEIKKLFLTSYNSKYQSNWDQIPYYDNFFFKNYIDFSFETNEVELGKTMANEILFNHSYVNELVVQNAIAFLNLEAEKTAEKLIDFNLYNGTIVWCLKTLGENSSICRDFSKGYLISKELAPNIIIKIITLFPKYTWVKSFSKKYLKTFPPDFQITSTIISHFWSEKWVSDFGRTWISKYADTDPYITAPCLRILGNDHLVSKKFIESIITTSRWQEYDFTIICNSIDYSGVEDVGAFFERYLEQEQLQQYQVITKVLAKLGNDNKKFLSYAKGYFEKESDYFKHDQITSKLINQLPPESNLASDFSATYLKENFGENIQVTNTCFKYFIKKTESDEHYSIPQEIISIATKYLKSVKKMSSLSEQIEEKIIDPQTMSVIIRLLKLETRDSSDFINSFLKTEIKDGNLNEIILTSCLVNLPKDNKLLIVLAEKIYNKNLFWPHGKYGNLRSNLLLIETSHVNRFKFAKSIIERRNQYNELSHKALLNSALLTIPSSHEMQGVYTSILKQWRTEIKPISQKSNRKKNNARKIKYYHRHLATCLTKLEDKKLRENILKDMSEEITSNQNIIIGRSLLELIEEYQ